MVGNLATVAKTNKYYYSPGGSSKLRVATRGGHYGKEDKIHMKYLEVVVKKRNEAREILRWAQAGRL